MEAERRGCEAEAEIAVEVVRPGLWSLRVVIPDNPLGYTLVYLFETRRGPVLVDTGWPHPDSWQALLDGIVRTGHSVEDVYGVLSTHHHNDHHGLAGRVREVSGAWVAMHEADARAVERRGMGDEDWYRVTRALMVEAARAAGGSRGIAEARGGTAAFPGTTGPVARRRRASRRAGVDLGGGVDTRSHARSSVLRRAHPPAVAVRRPPTARSHPAHRAARRHGGRRPAGGLPCLVASARVVGVPRGASGAPAPLRRRGRPGAGAGRPPRAAAGLRARHRRRGVRAAAWEVAERMEWNRPWSTLSVRTRCTALTEACAHLRHLEVRGLVLRGVRGRLPTWTATAAGYSQAPRGRL